MILVDTSALVPFFRGTDTDAARCLASALQHDIPVFFTPVVVQELLQGARNEKEWATLRRHLARQALVNPTDPLATHRRAARIYLDCRRRGLTIRSTIDCFVAQLALEHDLTVLQDDRDYQVIRAVRALKLLP